MPSSQTTISNMSPRDLPSSMPKATFYVWAKTDMGSAEFAEKMLDVGVVCTPGTGFGPTVDGFVRFAVTKPVDRIREALSRMEKLF